MERGARPRAGALGTARTLDDPDAHEHLVDELYAKVGRLLREAEEAGDAAEDAYVDGEHDHDEGHAREEALLDLAVEEPEPDGELDRGQDEGEQLEEDELEILGVVGHELRDLRTRARTRARSVTRGASPGAWSTERTCPTPLCCRAVALRRRAFR